MSSERQVVIELIGTPGAGKSTAAAALIEVLRDRGLRAGTIVDAARPHAVRTLPGRVVSLAPAGLRDPLSWKVFRVYGWLGSVGFRLSERDLVRSVTRSQRARPLSAASKRHTRSWFLRLAGRRRFLAKAPLEGEVLVIDDGFLHRSVALHASPGESVDPARVRAYVDLLGAPDLVVHVRAHPNVCLARIRARGPWRHRPGLSDADLIRYVDHADEVVRAAVERATERGWPVVVLDNEADGIDGVGPALEAVADRVAAGDGAERSRS